MSALCNPKKRLLYRSRANLGGQFLVKFGVHRVQWHRICNSQSAASMTPAAVGSMTHQLRFRIEYAKPRVVVQQIRHFFCQELVHALKALKDSRQNRRNQY